MQKKNSSIWSGKMHPGAVKKQERKKPKTLLNMPTEVEMCYLQREIPLSLTK